METALAVDASVIREKRNATPKAMMRDVVWCYTQGSKAEHLGGLCIALLWTLNPDTSISTCELGRLAFMAGDAQPC